MTDIMTVRAPEQMQDELKQIACQWGITRNALVLQILRDWLTNQKAASAR